MTDLESDPLNRDHIGANLLEYTRKAFRLLPPLDKPRILDIGCGSGRATLEIARLSGGEVVALDIDRQALERLDRQAARAGLSGQVTTVRRSMKSINFPSESFDIIWAEGAISFIGFKRGLKKWRRLLVPDGYLVVHDALSGLQDKIDLVARCGYTLLDHFELPTDIWWEKYYTPLKEQLERLRKVELPSRQIKTAIKSAEREIKNFDLTNDQYASVFLIMQKA